MFGFIENLRQKSEGYRRGVALSTSLIVTLMIFGVWITVLFPNVISPKIIVAKNETLESGSDFRQNLAQSFSAIKLQWSSVKEYFKTTTYESDSGAELEVDVPERVRSEIRENTAPESHNSATGSNGSVVY